MLGSLHNARETCVTQKAWSRSLTVHLDWLDSCEWTPRILPHGETDFL